MLYQIVNHILLSSFLYILYFYIGALLIYGPTPISQDNPIPDYHIAFSEENDPQPEENLLTSDAIVTPESSSQTTPEIKPDAGSVDASVVTNLLKSLKQPQLRKLCHPLGIKQKSQGAWLSTDSIRKRIQNQAKQNPQIVMEVVKNKLPKECRLEIE